MGTKVHHQPEFTGAAQLLMMIDLIRNVDRYQAEFQRLDDLRRQVNEGVEIKATLSEAQQMRQEATTDRTTAKQLLADAKARADELVMNANDAYREMVAEAERFAHELRESSKADIEMLKASAADALARVLEREREAEEAIVRACKAESSAADTVAMAHKLEQDAREAREMYEQKRAKLEGALQAAG